MNELHFKSRRRILTPSCQRGFVLFVTLIVIVSMALTGAALMRTVDTSVTALGNWALRQAARAPVFWAVDESLHFLETANTETHSNSDGYYASLQTSNSIGIPHLLIQPPFANTRHLRDATGNSIYYLIERMCLREGASLSEHCVPGILPDEVIDDPKRDEFPVALYRVTVRVDGPRQTSVYMQATIRHAEAPFTGTLKNKRISARFIEM